MCSTVLREKELSCSKGVDILTEKHGIIGKETSQDFFFLFVDLRENSHLRKIKGAQTY